MSEHTVVAVDGGPASSAAIGWVIDRLASVDMEVEIITVVEPGSHRASDAEGTGRDRHQQVLDAAKQRVLDAHPSASVATEVRHGVAAAELLSASQYAALLVIGTNRTSSDAGVMRGTLALTLAGEARCTTVVVPADWQPSSGPVVAGWTDDATSDAALDFAATEAVRRGAKLTVVHTWGAVPAAPLESAAPPAVEAAVAAEHRQILAGAAQRIRLVYPDLAVTHLLHRGSAAVAVVRAAAGASLVVVGSRGLGGLSAFFLGSVSHDVLLNLPAAVAVVPRARAHPEVFPEILIEDF